MRVFVILVALAACKTRPAPEPVELLPLPPATNPPSLAAATGGGAKAGDSVAVAARQPAELPRVAPPKQIPWSKPSRAPNDQERVLAGTWVAKVGDYASRSAMMADMTMFALDPANPDLVSNVANAVDKAKQVPSNCIWLELRSDFTGFRRECAVVNGEPTSLDQNDILTGQKKDFGTELEWFVDEADRNKVKIHFAKDMVVPARRGDKLALLVFRTWWLQLDKADATAGASHFLVKEWFPEHDYQLPTEATYMISSGGYLHR